MNRWNGRTALVTGASSGIGRFIAMELLKHGVNVVACARRIEAIEAIKGELKDAMKGQLMAVKCDVAKEEEILAMFEKIKASGLKGVDICINNAGFGDAKPLTEGETSVWRNMLEVNVLGLSICTREALKSMKERDVDDGHIIHLSSVAAYNIQPQYAFYCATKHAVRALTEGLRQELLAKKSGIRVTAISPGAVLTEFGNRMGNKAMVDAYYQNNPYLAADDIVASVLYALSAPKHVQIHDTVIYPVGQPE